MKRTWIASIVYLIVGVLIGAQVPRSLHAVRLSYARMRQEHRANQIREGFLQEHLASLTCNTIVQTYADVGVVPYLTADVPLGVTLPNALFEVRGPHETDPWQTCTAAGICDGAALPDVTHPGADPADGTPRYAASVSAATGQASGPGGKFDFASPRWIRLVTQYNMNPPPCVAQATFEVNANADYPTLMFIPPGRSITQLTTFGRELLPGKNWVQCDNVLNPPNGLWVGSGCSGMVLQFGYKPLPRDPSDGSTGLYIGCVSKYQSGAVNGNPITIASGSRLGCRIRLSYQ